MPAEIDDPTAVPKKKRGLLFYIVIGLILLILLAGGYLGAAFFLNLPPFAKEGPTLEEMAAMQAEEKEIATVVDEDFFVKFSNPFNFNLKDNQSHRHFAQIEVVLVVRGKENSDLAEKHKSLLESTVFEAMSSESFAILTRPFGRQGLKSKILSAVRYKMADVLNQPLVDRVLFTSFIIQ
ncbi:MAG: flagellar basal body-associated FliL family protein [Succinivibrionaceae bacterium]|nr:flagellar basal body-associated FliL family protein [Succinivibrionaceae bacterium]